MADASTQPRVSVVTASHDRPMRLRWLLNALEEQSVPAGSFEVIIAHDSQGPETSALLRDHPLTEAGVLRFIEFAPGSASPAEKRNAAWRQARARLVAFTDDDCRPEPTWLEALVGAESGDGVVLQGATRPDPFEVILQRCPWSRSVTVVPVHWHANTCNIAYPVDVLASTGGFDDTLPDAAGEDTDLWIRARAAGARMRAVPEAVVNHAVEPHTLRGHLRGRRRWLHLANVVKRHPSLRRHLFLGVFWRRRHATLLLALASAAAARRRPIVILLVLPWAAEALPPYGRRPQQRLHALAGLPARAIVDAYEIWTLARGSVRYRTLFL